MSFFAEITSAKTPVPFHRIGSRGSLALVSVGVERMSMFHHEFFGRNYFTFLFFSMLSFLLLDSNINA